MLFGADFSHYSSQLKWDKVMTEGYGKYHQIPKWAIWKATEGIWRWNGGRRYMWYDDLYEPFIPQIQASDIPDGSYHYYREQIDKYIPDPETQAKEYYGFVSSFPSNRMPPSLDIEKFFNPYLSAKNVWTCLYHIEKLFKRVPIIYTGYYIWRDMLKGPSWGSKYPLWLGCYNTRPLIPKPWTNYTIWQYDDTYGDENGFNGNENDLDKLCSDQNFTVAVAADLKPPTVVEAVKQVVGWYKKNGKLTTKKKG